MKSIPRWGILAGQSVDGDTWMQNAALPAGPRWITLQQPGDYSLIDLDGLAWLWQPRQNEEQLQQERLLFLPWARALIQARQNHLAPIILVAVEPLNELPEDDRQRAIEWLQGTTQQLKQLYRRELSGWVPAGLVDVSRITLQANGPEAGQRVADALSRLGTTVSLWKQKVHRQAERCLAAGLVLTLLYLSMLISTIFWKGKPAGTQRNQELVRWSPAEWQQHVSDCKLLLKQLHNRGYEQVSVEEQQRFNEHLRWLPISLDVLEQRRPTKEVQRWRNEVQTLLTQMETQLESWTKTSASTVMDRVSEQTRARQLLEGVFEPRRPPTVLHRAAAQYWQGERALLLAQLQAIVQGGTSRATMDGSLLSVVKEKYARLEPCRVHAPEMQTALLQELQSCIAWLETSLAKEGKNSDPKPALLAEVMK